MKLIECLISRPSDPCDMVFLWSGTADGHPNSSNLECTFFSTSDWLLDLIFRFSPSLLLSGRPSLFWVDKTGRFWLSFSPGLSWVLWWWLNKTGESEIWDPEVHKKGRQWRFITWTKECGSLPAVWIDFAQSTEPAEQGLRHHVDARLVATLLGAWHIEKKKTANAGMRKQEKSNCRRREKQTTANKKKLRRDDSEKDSREEAEQTDRGAMTNSSDISFFCFFFFFFFWRWWRGGLQTRDGSNIAGTSKLMRFFHD